MRDDLRFAERLADTADQITRAYIGAEIPGAATKLDGSPVTDVDLEVENTLLAIVERERPDEGFLGEEVGLARQGDRRWIVDGIDGTAAFVAGRPEWSTLIALVDRWRSTIGLVSAPALGRRWWALSGLGAWETHVGDETHREGHRLSVSGQRSLAKATIGVWPPAEAVTGLHRRAAVRLGVATRRNPVLHQARGRSTDRRPSWGSGFPNAGLLVAAGMLDGVVLFGGGPWDHAALAVIVEEAGGRFTDLSGNARIDTGGAVFSNGYIHPALLAVLNLGAAAD